MKKDMRAAAMATVLSVHEARGLTQKFAAERGPSSIPMYSAESQTEHSNQPDANMNNLARHSAMTSDEKRKKGDNAHSFPSVDNHGRNTPPNFK